MLDQPLFPIGIASELLNVHPETIRVWERSGIIKPQRRSGRRFYSEDDLKQLRFIKKLVNQDLNLPAIRYHLGFYPCWQAKDCPACAHRSEIAECSRPCWKEEGTYCQVNASEDACLNCEFRKESKAENIASG
jgi:MerR family transcriptional regulator/heat shock protein HspR